MTDRAQLAAGLVELGEVFAGEPRSRPGDVLAQVRGQTRCRESAGCSATAAAARPGVRHRHHMMRGLKAWVEMHMDDVIANLAAPDARTA
jgi:hypothetical protein